MDNRTRNPFDLEKFGNRLRFVALIDGLTVECDSHNRQQVKAAERLIALHNYELTGLQDACGLSHNATLKARQAMYEQWHYLNQNTESQPVAA